MRQPIDLVGGFYTDESLPWSCQDTVNYLPVAAEAGGTRTPTKLVDAPGLRPFVAIGNTDGDPTAGAPIRGLHDVEGRLFVVSGQMLYEISQTGVAIPRGMIPGVGRVSMAHNQRSHGHELLVVNGSGGYVYNTATDNFTIVTDPGYPGAGVADFLDGYLMQVEPFGRFLFHSDLADALEYNTLDRFEAETQPDRVVGMIVNHQEVWAFGDRTIDVFGNVGTAQGTFQNKGVSISRGCIAKWSPAIIDNGVAWLGDDRVVYHARGYDPVRISTRAIEVALSQCSLADIRNAFSFVWSDRGHSVYYLTIPNGLTFGYDFSTGLWHRRATWHPELDMGGRWRLADLVRHNGQWIGGDYRDGRLYALDWDYMLEGCEPLVRDRVAPLPHNDGRGINVHSVEMLYDTGGPASDCAAFPWPPQPPSPVISGNAPDGVKFLPYEGYSYTASGGTGTLSFSISSGELPPGLELNPASGLLSGTTTEAGTFGFVVRVTDQNGIWAEVADGIVVSASIMALVNNSHVFYGDAASLEEGPAHGLSGLNAIALSPNSLFIAGSSNASPHLQIRKLRADRTGYNPILPPATVPTNDSLSCAFSPDGRFLAVSWLTGGQNAAARLYIYEISGDEFTLKAQADGFVGLGVSWSYDSRKIAWSQGVHHTDPSNGLAVFDFDGEALSGRRHAASNPFAQSPIIARFDPTGEFLVAESNNGMVVYRDSGGPVMVVDSNSTFPGSRGAYWSAGSDYIYAVASTPVAGNRVGVYGFTGSSLTGPIYPASQPPTSINDSALSSDGASLALGLSSQPGQSLYVYSVENAVLTAEPRPVTSGHTSTLVEWTP